MWLPSVLLILSMIYMYVHAASDDMTKTIVLNTTTSIFCENGLKINIKQVDINRTSRQCVQDDKECNVSDDTLNMMMNICNNQMSCAIDMHTIPTNPFGCLLNLGYFNFTYSCETNVMSCNFETDWCGWLMENTDTNFRWEREKENNYKKIPSRDHTYASLNGSYAYIFSTTTNKMEGPSIAHLYLENIVPSAEQCLSFWYYIMDKEHSLEVFWNEQGIVNVTRHFEERWYYAKIPINKSPDISQEMRLYKISFKVIKRKEKTDGAIAIDDILLANRACTDSLHECNFEDNACYANTISGIKGTYSWIRQKGESLYEKTGPPTDHTTGSVYGQYMYLDSYNGSYGDIAYSRGPSVEVDEKSCLTFWYHMFGTHVGMLNVTLNKNPIWSDYGDKGDNWNLAKLEINSQGILIFEFVGIYGSGLLSDIAVDDILLLPGSCSGVIDHQQICVNLDHEMHRETYCPKGYLDLANVLSNPEKTNGYCSSIYYQTKLRLLDECKGRTDSQKCLIDLSTDISFHPECFQLFEIRIHHTCEEEDTSISSDITSTGYSNTGDRTTITPVINAREDNSSDDTTAYAVVVSTLVIIMVVALVFTLIICHFQKRTKSSKLCDVRPNTTVTETIDSSGYNIINYNNMTGISIPEKDKNRHEINATNRQSEDIKTAIEQQDTICNKYESLSTNRKSIEHIYESDSIHTNQYESLTNQQESDKHTYESTEHALPVSMEKELSPYESLTYPSESDKHVYASTHTNQYESLSKQRESDKHTNESSEHALPVFMEQELFPYQSLTNPPESDKHVYASTHTTCTNQFKLLSKQRESDKHTYESTEHALPVSMEQELSQYQSLTNPPESDKHVYASTHTNQYET